MGSQHAKPPLEPMRFARNGKYPDALMQDELADLANKIALYRMKEIARFNTNMNAITADSGSADERVRWRAAFRSSQYAAAICAHAWLAPAVPELVSSDPYARVRIQTGVPATLGDAVFPFGASVSDSDVSPSKLVPMWNFLAAPAGGFANPAADTEYYVTVSDFQSRIVSISIFEVPLNTPPPFSEGYALGTPIWNTDRSAIAAAARLAWKQQGAQSLNWSVDQDSAARTRSSATSINAIDNSSGAPSASTPGYTLDFTKRSTERRVTVPVVFKAYAKMSIGAVTGNVKLKDSAGSTVATVAVNSNTAGWFSTTANLPATNAKYDLHYEGDGTNTLTFYAASLYPHASGS